MNESLPPPLKWAGQFGYERQKAQEGIRTLPVSHERENTTLTVQLLSYRKRMMILYMYRSYRQHKHFPFRSNRHQHSA